MPLPVRLLVIEGQPLLCEALRSRLVQEPHIAVVGTAMHGADALHLMETLRPTVVLLSLDLPDINSVALIKQLRDVHPRSHIIVLAANLDALMPAVHAGASSYLDHGVDTATLIAAIHAVARGESVLQPHIARRVIDLARSAVGPAPSNQRDPSTVLTRREYELLLLLMQGFSNKMIAEQLVITDGTVKRHLNNIFNKLGVRNRREAVRQAALLGLV